MIRDILRDAVRNIWGSKLRTAPTMLGIIIGVMAVIVIVALGNGMTQNMEESFSSLGTNTLTVNVFGYGARSVSVDQVYEITEAHPELFSALSPSVGLNGTVKIQGESCRSTSAAGVSKEYLSLAGYTVAQGRGLNYIDIQDNKRVCVIGAYLARTAFGGSALGQTLKIGADRYTVVGVLEAQISDPDSQEDSTDDLVLVPYTTALRLSQSSTASSYTAALWEEDQAAQGKQVLEEGLYALLRSDTGCRVTSMSEMLDTMTSMIGMVVTILSAIAAISLLVGGIGIMNIMMVSVTERTREIGVRKALGAQESSILALFVTEAGLTSALGGLAGIALGYLGAKAAGPLLALLLPDLGLTARPTLGAAVTAFGISVGIGVLFGCLPARRAARMDPIQALRYD